MIEGPTENDAVLWAITTLLHSQFLFVFTGSRANREPNTHSDYDFIVQDSPEVMDFLEQRMRRLDNYPEPEVTQYRDGKELEDFCEFTKAMRELDSNTCAVFRYGKKGGINVDVCIVKDVDKRLKMIEYVTKNYTQEQQKCFSTQDWNRMYDLCQN